eukprot:gene19987-21947_t
MMNLDLVKRRNFYAILLAIACLLMLLHTIRLVDIPLGTMMFQHNCNTLIAASSGNVKSWPSDHATGLNLAARDGSPTATANYYSNGDRRASRLLTTDSDNVDKESNYDSFTEVLSDKRLKHSQTNSKDESENDEKQKRATIDHYMSEYTESQPLRYRKYGEQWLMTNDELQFLRAWCIQRDYRVNWQRILGSCVNHTKWTPDKPQWTPSTVTTAAYSYVFGEDIKPTGQFSRFFIQSVSQDGTKKSIGGDSWRVHVAGATSIPVTIVDHDDGRYEVLFLVVEPGKYTVNIVLEYTLCDGMKDPPKDWFIKGNAQGKYQHPDVLPGFEHPLLLQALPGGLNFTVKSSSVSVFKEMSESGILDKYCPNPSCMMWNGFGRWTNNVWKPYIKENIGRDSTDHRDGLVWIYGDSNGDLFYKSLMKRRLCKELTAGCDHTYNWVYKIQENNINQAKMLWDNKDFSIDRILSELDDVLGDARMNDHSVLIINMGLHYVQGITFDKYRKLIDRTIDLFTSHKHSPQGFHGKIIWKTTTALFRERYGDPKTGARHAKGLRFLTVPRVQLFNAYATSAMCKNEIDVLDVYPISDSYPGGSGGVSKQWDAVHFKRECFAPVEDLLEEYLG